MIPIKKIIKSFLFFIKIKKYDIVFVYLNHFNRGIKNENYFLIPFLEICRKNDLSYIMIEETDLKGAYSNYPRNNDAIPLDFITLLQVFLRKLYKLKSKNYRDYYEREVKISNRIKFFFLRNFEAKNFILLAHNNAVLWRTVCPDAKIFDYQHGMIWNGHDGTLVNGIPAPVKTFNNIISLLYGEGFQRVLLENDKTGFYNKDTAPVIGFYHEIEKYKKSANNKCILYTLQNVDLDTNEHYYSTTLQVIDALRPFAENHNYRIYIKNHPRYDINDPLPLEVDLSNIQILDDNVSILDIQHEISIHITSKSTTAFDLALKGIPTIFIDMLEERSPFNMFFQQYHYPLHDFRVSDPDQLAGLLHKLENLEYYSKSCLSVYEWACGFYQKFDEKLFLTMIGHT